MRLPLIAVTAATLLLAACGGVLPEEPEDCDDEAIAASDVVLPGDPQPGETGEEDADCGLGNSPDKTDADNPGKGHNKT